MELIETSKEATATFGVMLEASASALTQGPMGWNCEQFAAKYFGKH